MMYLGSIVISLVTGALIKFTIDSVSAWYKGDKTMSAPEYITLSQSAYKAYGKATDFKNYQGLPMPKWEDLPEPIKKAWDAAVDNVLTNMGHS